MACEGCGAEAGHKVGCPTDTESICRFPPLEEPPEAKSCLEGLTIRYGSQRFKVKNGKVTK